MSDEKMDKLMKKEKEETERIDAMLDNVDRLIKLSNKRDQIETIAVLLVAIKEEIKDSSYLLELSREELIKRIDCHIK